jgi:hypothetical protein
VVDPDLPRAGHLADDGDMATGHPARGGEGEHGPALRHLPARVGRGGAMPPFPRITLDLDAGGEAREGHAGEAGGGCHGQDGRAAARDRARKRGLP